MPYVGRSLNTGEFKVITLSESFDGNRVDFTMSESVGNVNQLIVILSGVVQHWTDAFTVSGTTLTFSSAPSNGETIKILKLGDTNDIGVPSDASVTADKLASTLNLSSKTLTLPASSVTAHVTQYDDNKIQSNIALLGFKTAVNGSLAKYNLQDQIIDEYTDATGVDSGASTAASLTSGAYSGIATPTNNAVTSTTDGADQVLKWTNVTTSGSISFASDTAVEYLVVAGGGAGGQGNAGGGGAGGYLANNSKALTMTAGTTYTISVGAGGLGGSGTGASGGNSSIAGSGLSTLLADGGGGAASGSTASLSGGSGGGGGYANGAKGTATGNGTGHAGGQQSTTSPEHGAGGGGGAGAVGANGTNSAGGVGGVGLQNDITGTNVYYAGGGGGSSNSTGNTFGAGGNGGGGRGSGGTADGAIELSDATANTGGGGGGVYNHTANRGGHGGSGIVVIRYANVYSNMTLQSTDTTAMTAPTTADMVMLMENSAGTATLNTDIKGYISRDSGANFTQGTLVDEGSWGTNKKILAFHDLDISSQPSGTSMCYKITTHNQAAGKQTKVHATSIGWK